jgi:predicted dehydrogenase
MYTIIGGGFGLYGYLPAILNTSSERGVLLAEKYRKVIESRSDLNIYTDSIEWCSSVPDALSKATGVVIAIPPQAQREIIESVIKIENLKKIIIEKPICPQPNDAKHVTSNLQDHSKHFRVGYTFLYTHWCSELQARLRQPAARLHINWSFKADHFIRGKDTWKRYHSLGGGVMRFYGIQVLAVLASLGYSAVVSSKLFERLPDQPDIWTAQFSGTNIPLCDICIDTNADNNSFQIMTGEDSNNISIFYSDVSPFVNASNAENQDNRVPILQRLLCSMNQDEMQYMALYHVTNELWALAEMKHGNSHE